MRYKVGDKVRVRQWDDMEKEFDLDSAGDIKCYGCFVKAMRPTCGQIATIIDLSRNGESMILEGDTTLPWQYLYTTQMIELVEEVKEHVETTKETVEESKHESDKEMVHHPDHYNVHKYECIQEMIAVFGKQAVIDFCKINVWKYRYRNGSKEGTDDAKKADEYMTILMELQND